MAARFWVGGTGNWDAADTTHWAATSGGAGGQSVPGASDDVTFDGSSGGGTVTMTAGTTVLTITGGAFTGTLNTNGQTINVGTFNFSGTGTRTLTLGASAINVTGSSATTWNMGTATNLTVTANTATITLSGSTVIMSTGGKNYGGTIALTGAGQATLSGGGTHANVTRTGTAVKTDTFRVFTDFTVTGTLTINGNSSTNRVLVFATTLGTARTLTAAAVSISNADFRDITGAGAANWDLSAITGGSGDCGGNSGITFTTAATQTYTGGTDNWSTAARWTSRVPLPQDDVSMSGVTGGTITADMPRLGKSIDWTGASGSPTWTLGLSPTNYGSLTLISSMTFSPGSNSFTFEGRGAFTLTSSGKAFGTGGVTVAMVGGSLTPQDASIFYTGAGGSVVLTDGSLLNSGNYSVSAYKVVTDNASRTRRLDLGNATWTIVGVDSAQQVFDNGTTTGLTFNANSSTIYFSDVSGTAKTLVGGGLTYNDLKIAGGGAGAIIITGANTFNRIYTDGGGTKSITLPGSTTTTILSGSGLGNGTNVITFTASAGSATVAKSGGGTVGYDYVHLTNIIASTANTWYAGTHSTDNGGNTNWIFTAVPADYYSASINDFKQAWYASRGYTRTLNDNELAYFNTQNSTTFISIRDAKERYFINLGYSGTLGDMYYKSLLTTMGLSASSFSLTDVERIFYSNTSNEFA